ncbi:hypothetical protein QFZ27_002166 [Inquilinus ginsengisoli]|uniref:hypothetical protein n=1 Tax=Inquilinus ginsengisoli TaxID=363840 RepID=UPI003D19C220
MTKVSFWFGPCVAILIAANPSRGGPLADPLIKSPSESLEVYLQLDKPDYDAIAAKQLAMNAQTWRILLAQGVTEQTSLKLDFTFTAPTREAADGLISLLKEETDYELRSPQPAGSSREGDWLVSGSTQATTISLEILDQWVIWMIVAGNRGNGCVFDGWGAEIPN